jgi:hypothetical protein
MAIERAVQLSSIKYVGMSNLQDDWVALALESPNEPDIFFSCVFKTELVTRMSLLMRGLDIRIAATYILFTNCLIVVSNGQRSLERRQRSSLSRIQMSQGMMCTRVELFMSHRDFRRVANLAQRQGCALRNSILQRRSGGLPTANPHNQHTRNRDPFLRRLGQPNVNPTDQSQLRNRRRQGSLKKLDHSLKPSDNHLRLHHHHHRLFNLLHR